jgi:hypothetical protein
MTNFLLKPTRQSLVATCLISIFMLVAAKASATTIGTFAWIDDPLFGVGFEVTNDSGDLSVADFTFLSPQVELTFIDDQAQPGSQVYTLVPAFGSSLLVLAGGSANTFEDFSLITISNAHLLMTLCPGALSGSTAADVLSLCTTTSFQAADLSVSGVTRIELSLPAAEVPEPASILLVGSLLAWRGRRLKRK